MGGSDNKGDGLASEPRCYQVPGQHLLNLLIRRGVSPAAQMGCLRNRSRSRLAVKGERDIWWTLGATRGAVGHLGLMHTETQRGRLWTACAQRRVDSKNC